MRDILNRDMEAVKITKFKNGMTVKGLKELIKDWPDKDDNGEENEVWLSSGKHLSSQCKSATPLNLSQGCAWVDLDIQ